MSISAYETRICSVWIIPREVCTSSKRPIEWVNILSSCILQKRFALLDIKCVVLFIFSLKSLEDSLKEVYYVITQVAV